MATAALLLLMCSVFFVPLLIYDVYIAGLLVCIPYMLVLENVCFVSYCVDCILMYLLMFSFSAVVAICVQRSSETKVCVTDMRR